MPAIFRSKKKRKHIYCIEGDWTHNKKDHLSVKYALDFLNDVERVKSLRRSGSNKETVKQELKESKQAQHKEDTIIYLAFHGKSGEIKVGKRQYMTLDEIADVLDGAASNKIIHFGCCSTLKGKSGWDLKRFLKKTGALAVSGYTTDIDFLISTVLDIIYFRECQKHFDVRTIRRNVLSNNKQLVKQLGFRMYTHSESKKAK